ncbi:MAG TPA: DUF4162 domain-containing protein, partial [Polyangiaceae bacterium]|nr:DUF4162 domain-containing protein [Polyangiaceae bacterium]
RHVIWDLLRELRAGGDLTISLTTHYLDEADALCDHVAIVDQGKVVALGTPGELKSRVPGSDTIELSLESPLPDAVLRAIERLDGARSVERTALGARVRADGGAELLPRALDVLREAGVRVRAASVNRVTLEDVFMHFTGRSLRDEPVDAREGTRAAIRRLA